LRPADPSAIRRKLRNGLHNENPKSPLAWALYHRKTIRVGNKTDPFQDIENEMHITERIIMTLIELGWEFVIQTRHLSNTLRIEPLLQHAHEHQLLIMLPIISPGAEYDWEVFERKRTTPIDKRLRIIKRMVRRRWRVGVNGEPFIPGVHTVEQFHDMLKRLKAVGVRRYNTYNFHFNEYVAKRLNDIGIDIERIWYYNQDKNWRPIQQKLCEIADKEGFILGCPDFVNTGRDWREQANTCCGIDVSRPCTFNTHFWKRWRQDGLSPDETLKRTWDGVGEFAVGEKIVKSKTKDLYTLKDAGL